MERQPIHIEAEALVRAARELKAQRASVVAMITPQEGDPPEILESKQNLTSVLEERLRERHGYLLTQMATAAQSLLSAIDASPRKTELASERHVVVARTNAHGNTMSVDKVIDVGTVLGEIANKVEQMKAV